MRIKLNLIPPAKKEEILKMKYFIFALRWGIKLGFILLILAAVLLSTEHIFKMNLTISSSKEDMRTINQLREIKKYDDEFKNINAQIEEIRKLQNGQYYWSKIFSILNQKVPANIEIISLNTKNLSISLNGKAKTRETLINFRQKLEEDECFEKIKLPLSDLVVKNDINFQIDFNLKEECIKNE